MAAYSLDLRERIVATYDAGGASRAAVAARFAVSLGRVKKLLSQRRRAGHLAPLAHGGGQKALLGAEEHQRLRAAVAAKNDASLAELVEVVRAANGRRVSIPTMSRVLLGLGLGRKKEPARPGGR
jgi:transposase